MVDSCSLHLTPLLFSEVLSNLVHFNSSLSVSGYLGYFKGNLPGLVATTSVGMLVVIESKVS